ncbi:MAG: thiamine-phosphate kinase [Pseudomonadota bacterium]
MNETEFVAALRGLPLHAGARNLKDDCALIEIGGETLIVTQDMMAEDTHFLPDADPADIAWKLIAMNLSDLASKGAEPLGVLLGHSLGGQDERFLSGLREALVQYGLPLLGGDTIAATGASTFSATAIGRATHVPVPSRSGAQAGDNVFVTGTLGRALLGFEGQAEHRDAFNRPQPRLAEGRALAPRVTAMMDVSDGLLLDCWRLAEASSVTVALASAAPPVADERRRSDALRWGDDYELLFALPRGTLPPVPATMIGTVEPRGFAELVIDGEPVVNSTGLGYQHG